MISRRFWLTLALSFTVAKSAWATAQIPEMLLFDGREEMLFSEPLTQYVMAPDHLATFQSQLGTDHCTGSWRNYQGTWEIRNSRLYLTRLVTDPCDPVQKEIPLSRIFPFDVGPVFARWYTGVLVVPVGRRTRYVHMGYESRFEWYITFSVIAGKIVGRSESSKPPK